MLNQAPVTGVDRQKSLYNLAQQLKDQKHRLNNLVLEYLLELRALGHACFDRLSKQAQVQIPQCYDLK